PAGLLAGDQVLFDRQFREYAPFFRYVAQSKARYFVWLSPGQVLPHEAYVTLAPDKQTHDGLERSGFARPVASHQAHHFAAPNVQTDVAQDMCSAVPGMQSGDRQHWHHGRLVKAHGATPCGAAACTVLPV